MIPVIDLHCDTIMALYQNKDKELKSNDLQIDINKLKTGNYLAQVFAMFVYLKGNLNPFKTCDEMIDLFYSELEKNKEEIKIENLEIYKQERYWMQESSMCYQAMYDGYNSSDDFWESNC